VVAALVVSAGRPVAAAVGFLKLIFSFWHRFDAARRRNTRTSLLHLRAPPIARTTVQFRSARALPNRKRSRYFAKRQCVPLPPQTNAPSFPLLVRLRSWRKFTGISTFFVPTRNRTSHLIVLISSEKQNVISRNAEAVYSPNIFVE